MEEVAERADDRGEIEMEHREVKHVRNLPGGCGQSTASVTMPLQYSRGIVDA